MAQDASQAARDSVQPIQDWAQKYVYGPVEEVGKLINKVPSSDDLKRAYHTRSEEVKNYIRKRNSSRKPKPYKTAQ